MGNRYCLLLILVLLGIQAYGQNQLPQGIRSNSKFAGSKQLQPHKAPKYLRFEPGSVRNGLSASDLEQQLHLPAQSALVKDATASSITSTKEVFQQFHIGYPVEGAVYYLHYNSKRELTAANGELWLELPETATVTITEAAAIEQARKSAHFNGASSYKLSEAPSLVFAPTRNETGKITGHRLSYKVDVYTISPLRRAWIYIDAENGKELYAINRIHENDATGTAHTRYSGQQSISTKKTATDYQLRDYSRAAGIITRSANRSYDYQTATDVTDADNVWNTTTNYVNSAYDAHWGAIKTFDFFKQSYGMNSYDNKGAAINLYVNYGESYNNAFWNGESMVFGDGSNSTGGFSPLTSIDVVAHEYTHAITSNSARLVYSYESGALNESFSDIFGTVVEHFAKPETADYLVGEEITIGRAALRSMINPNDYQHPDTYKGTYYYTGSGDNGGVHYNSGVQNYWFYVLAQGANGTNDLGNTFSVTGIGITKASAIAYRNLTTYLTPNSTFEDAAFFAIKAADDLYGACSAESIATANAWYAVGVIEKPSFETTANFTASQTYSCSLENSIKFTNSSQWAGTYLWNFGDGSTSTEVNPTYTYKVAGTYTVTLTAYPDGSCGTTSHTLTKTDHITVEEGTQPVPATCTPVLSTTCCSVGIKQVQIGSTQFTTTEWQKGYYDYTCQKAITLTQGERTTFRIDTRYESGERLQAWADWNNNGTFEATEVFYTSGAAMNHSHSGNFVVPGTVQANTVIRMRIRSTAYYAGSLESCDNIMYGEVQDYKVLVNENKQAPSANFIVAGVAVPNQDITFKDDSEHVPSSWQWTFEGASIATSNVQNPVVRFTSNGTYKVTLTATNAYGSSTVTKNISINNEQLMCTDTQSSALSGVLYDSGGKNGNYRNSESCSFIYNGCGPVTLDVKLVGIEYWYDQLTIYDGNSSSGTQLYHSGYNNNGTYTAQSGSFYVEFYSDSYVTAAGFEIKWNRQDTGTEPPVASFEVADPNPPVNTNVRFTNTSSTAHQYLWTFGDGGSSTEREPVHIFTKSGEFRVGLQVTNCQGTTSTIQTIKVQQSPKAVFDNTARTVRLKQNEAYTIPMSIGNTGTGDLVWEHVSEVADKVTIWNYYAYYNNISYLLQNKGYHTQYYEGQGSATDLKTMLSTSSILVIPRVYGGLESLRAAKADIKNFVEKGGILLMTGQESTTLNEFGFFQSSNYSTISYGLLKKENTSHPLLKNISGDIYAYYYTYSHTFSNKEGMEEVLSYEGQTTAAVKAVGSGYAIYLGLDYSYYSNDNLTSLLENAASAYLYSAASWIQLPTAQGVIKSNSSSQINTTINSTGLAQGQYRGGLRVWTNDTANTLLKSPINLIVTNQDVENFSWKQVSICAGKVTFLNESTLSNSRSFHWDFGDGNSSTEAFPEHNYSQPGTYAVTLTVKDASGSRRLTRDVVTDFLTAQIQVVDSAHIGRPVAFKVVTQGTPTSLSWDFGDGYSASIANPKHSYDAPGIYTVRLVLKSSNGCETVFEKPLLVGNFAALSLDALPAHEFTFYPNPATDKVLLNMPAGRWQLAITDQQGRKLQDKRVNSTGDASELDVSTLPPGLYILHISNGKQQAYRKIIIH